MRNAMREPIRQPGRQAVAALALLGAGALALVTGCTGDGGQKAAPRTATGTVEQLAAKTSCKPDMQVDAAELRQGICTTDKGRYVLTTFATNQGLLHWLDEAQSYGGTYLVGKKWVAVGEPKVLTALRGQLGGEVETASHSHSGDAGGHSGSSDEHEHSGHHGN